MTQPMPWLAHYESVAATSARMLAAARAGDWESLVNAEAECAEHIRALQALEAEASVRRDAAGNRARIHILQRILLHDAEIRNLTQSWLRGLEKLLRTAGLDRLVRSAYGPAMPDGPAMPGGPAAPGMPPLAH